MKTFRSVVYSLFIFITIVLLINSNFIGNFYWQQLSLFGDHETLVNWLECNSIGVDLYTTEQLVCNNKNISIFNYGHILLVYVTLIFPVPTSVRELVLKLSA